MWRSRLNIRFQEGTYTNEFADKILSYLEDSIALSDENSRKFVRNSSTDFTRKRKLHYTEMIRLILSIGAQMDPIKGVTSYT